MRIAIVNENFGLGGIQRVSKVIGDSLKKNNEVYFYSIFSNQNYFNVQHNFINGSFPILKNSFLKGTGKARKVITKSVFHKEYSNAQIKEPYLKKLLSFIFWANIDVVIVTGPTLISCIDYLKSHSGSTIRWVAWIHNNYHTYMDNYTVGYQTEFINGLRNATAVVCLTQDDREQYAKFNSQTHLIYNPLTINNTNISDLSAKKICFTGRIAFQHKGIDFLLEIASRLSNGWKIEIAGSGSNKQEKELMIQIKRRHLDKKIVFRGPLSGNSLNQHYLDSSIYLMTSRWEGMPLVLAEAMSFGLPIIAFNQSGSAEVLGKGKYGILVENGNIDEMVFQLKQLMSNIEMRKEYQNISLQRIQDFDLTKITKTWTRLLEGL